MERYKWRGWRDGPRVSLFKDRAALAVILLVAVIVVLPIVINVTKPLWFDEVWRADIISRMRLWRYDGEPPVSLLWVLLIKLPTLIYNAEFTQRLLNYLFALGIIPMAYVYGKSIRGRNFGLFLASVSPFSLYYLDYLIQNKPFLADAFLAILFLYLFDLFTKKRLRIEWLIIYSVAYILVSTTASFMFVSAGIYLAFLVYHKKVGRKDFFAWSAVIGLTCLVYYLFYLKPQLTPGLSAFHSPNIWLGKPLAWQLDFFWQHIITIFGFPANQVNNLKIIYPIVDTGAISFRASMPALTRFEPLVAFIIFACFTLGVASLWRRKQYSLPLAVVVAIISTLIFSALNIWPFGNNRANIFLFYMVAIVAWLGIFEIISFLYKKQTSWAAAFLVIILVGGSQFIPMAGFAKRILHPRGEMAFDGMRQMSEVVREKSKPEDAIIVFQYMSQQPFHYYYDHYSSTVSKNSYPSRMIIFDTLEKPLQEDERFYRDLAAKYKTVWVIAAAGIARDVVKDNRSYRVVSDKSVATIRLVQLTRD